MSIESRNSAALAAGQAAWDAMLPEENDIDENHDCKRYGCILVATGTKESIALECIVCGESA